MGGFVPSDACRALCRESYDQGGVDAMEIAAESFDMAASLTGLPGVLTYTEVASLLRILRAAKWPGIEPGHG